MGLEPTTSPLPRGCSTARVAAKLAEFSQFSRHMESAVVRQDTEQDANVGIENVQ